MRSQASFRTAAVALAICFVCQVAEIFDQWDHTLQTGDDTEYTFVILALCVGIGYSLKWFIPRIALPESQTEAIMYRRCRLFFSVLDSWTSAVPIPASPPLAALRI
jgi:hypothetical protein